MIKLGEIVNIPRNVKEIEVLNATVQFYEDENNYYFDSSLTAPPDPMINAVLGLKLLNENKKLVMINHKVPLGLFPKIEAFFDYDIQELEDGNVKIIFSKKSNCIAQLDFDTNCKG
jgi:hypothetical protein